MPSVRDEGGEDVDQILLDSGVDRIQFGVCHALQPMLVKIFVDVHHPEVHALLVLEEGRNDLKGAVEIAPKCTAQHPAVVKQLIVILGFELHQRLALGPH